MAAYALIVGSSCPPAVVFGGDAGGLVVSCGASVRLLTRWTLALGERSLSGFLPYSSSSMRVGWCDVASAEMILAGDVGFDGECSLETSMRAFGGEPAAVCDLAASSS